MTGHVAVVILNCYRKHNVGCTVLLMYFTIAENRESTPGLFLSATRSRCELISACPWFINKNAFYCKYNETLYFKISKLNLRCLQMKNTKIQLSTVDSITF